MQIVFDTHTLLWYLKSSELLSEKAKEIILKIEQGEGVGYIPTIVLAELQFIFEKTDEDFPLERVVTDIENSTFLNVIPFDTEHLLLLPEIKEIPEMHDRIIVAAAKLYDAVIVSKDREISNYEGMEVVW